MSAEDRKEFKKNSPGRNEKIIFNKNREKFPKKQRSFKQEAKAFCFFKFGKNLRSGFSRI